MSDNRLIYENPRVVAGYRRTTPKGLTYQEQFCLDLIPRSDRGSVLDIGIGAGRTTAALADAFASYVGVDYSTSMVDAAKAQFPDRDLRVMDARHLQFASPFDCVVFSFNGIDYVELEDRQRILEQIKSVLRPGGHFLYSTHNLGFRAVSAWLERIWVEGMATPLRRIRFLPRRVRNFRRQKLDPQLGTGYVNDPGNDFALLTLYVDIPRELERLRSLGFRILTTIGNSKQAEGYDADDNWVYVLAQRR
ncbi:MAG TPA: class I SAM-dependent methyltransferase [Xanthobacteraceae bacterium]|jgi:SAM-dependent methyltransferase|nr:class I SAM-dependent methyltransferase [Xanthobacteraceae bacterium]